MKMHDALEVIAEGQRGSPVDFRYVAKNTQSGSPKVIVEVCGNDPDRGRAAEEPEQSFREDDLGGKARSDSRSLTRS